MRVDLPVHALHDLSQPLADSWNIVKVGFGRDNANSEVEVHDGRGCLRVHYPKGSGAPSCVPEQPLGGIGFYSVPQAALPCTDAVLEYSVRFDETFDPCKGGKLPGLYLSPPGAQNFQGGTGGKKNALTASCRVMWRSGLAAEAYVYRPQTQGAAYSRIEGAIYNAKYGDSLWRGELKFVKDRWNTVRVRVRLNTIGREDGIVQVAVNGVQRSFTGIVWRTDPSVRISSIIFDTFFGGSSIDYASARDTCTRFSDVRLTRVA